MTETPGFLTAQEDSPFRAHAYIASMARSGSTLLCNILTRAPTHWMMIEPWFIHGATAAGMADMAVTFGIAASAADWQLPTAQRTPERLRQRYQQLLAPKLSGLQRWGAKEVKFDFHQPTIDTIRPRRILINTRDIHQIYLSLREKAIRQGQDDINSREWAERYCLENAAAMVRLVADLGDRVTGIARYEDFAHSQQERQRIADMLDWPLLGDEAGRLRDIDRGYEVERHQNSETVQITAQSRGLPPEEVRIADSLAERCQDYQRAFGYL